MGCHEGACEYPASPVRACAVHVSAEQRLRTLAFLEWVRDLMLKARDVERAGKWQMEIDRIEKDSK